MTEHRINRTESNTAIVFDLDGTLVDTSEDLSFSINYMRNTLGLPPLTTPEVLRAVGRGAGLLIEKTLEVSSRDTERYRELLETFRAHYRAHQGERSAPYPLIAKTLTLLADRSDLYVLSNKPIDATLREIELAGLTDRFQAIWGAGSFDRLKPEPDGLIAAMERSGTDTSRTVMVGDLYVDIETAARAGVPAIFVSWGFGKREDLPHTPDAEIDAPARLPGALAALPGLADIYADLL